MRQRYDYGQAVERGKASYRASSGGKVMTTRPGAHIPIPLRQVGILRTAEQFDRHSVRSGRRILLVHRSTDSSPCTGSIPFSGPHLHGNGLNHLTESEH